MTVSQPIAGSEIAAVVIAAVQAYLEDEAASQAACKPTTIGAWRSAVRHQGGWAQGRSWTGRR